MIGYPFDSRVTFDEQGNPSYDRAISSVPLKHLIRKLFTTGVMPNPSDNLQVFEGLSGMTVIVHAGFCVIDGGLKLEETNRTLEVQAADTTYDRIDTVVMRWNDTSEARNCDLYILQGTPSANPVRPTLTRGESIYEIGLADLFITKNITTVAQERITDTRYDAERCGIVSSVSEWDTSTIYAQVQADLADFKAEEQAEFLVWFESIKDILDENVAAHLQNEIDALTATVAKLTMVRHFNVPSGQWGANPDSGTNTDYPYLCDVGIYPQNSQFNVYPIRQNEGNIIPQRAIDKIFELALTNENIDLHDYHYMFAWHYDSEADTYLCIVLYCGLDSHLSAYTDSNGTNPFSNTYMPMCVPTIDGKFRDWRVNLDFNNNEFTWTELTPSGGATASYGRLAFAHSYYTAYITDEDIYLDNQGTGVPTTGYPMGMLCVLHSPEEGRPSGIFDDDAEPIWDLGGTGTLPTSTERESIDMILEGIFNSQGIKLYATDLPTADLTLRTKGE